MFFSKNSLATAKLAQLFGSELLKVQNSSTTDGGQQPHIVSINPKQFLGPSVNHSVSNIKREEERRILDALQREAEAVHPLPRPTVQTETEKLPPPLPSQTYQTTQTNVIQHTNPLSPVTPQLPQHQNFDQKPNWSNDPLERIASSLEIIANNLQRIDFTAKKRRRTTKKTNS